jgi:hypothetical protein
MEDDLEVAQDYHVKNKPKSVFVDHRVMLIDENGTTWGTAPDENPGWNINRRDNHGLSFH